MGPGFPALSFRRPCSVSSDNPQVVQGHGVAGGDPEGLGIACGGLFRKALFEVAVADVYIGVLYVLGLREEPGGPRIVEDGPVAVPLFLVHDPELVVGYGVFGVEVIKLPILDEGLVAASAGIVYIGEIDPGLGHDRGVRIGERAHDRDGLPEVMLGPVIGFFPLKESPGDYAGVIIVGGLGKTAPEGEVVLPERVSLQSGEGIKKRHHGKDRKGRPDGGPAFFAYAVMRNTSEDKACEEGEANGGEIKVPVGKGVPVEPGYVKGRKERQDDKGEGEGVVRAYPPP